MDRASHEFLSSARFTNDKDIAARRRGEFYQPIQRLHVFTCPDKIVPAFRYFITQKAIFTVQDAYCEGARHRQLNSDDLEWADNVVGRTELHRFHRPLERPRRCESKDRAILAALPQHTQKFEPVHAWHSKVGYPQVEVPRL